MFLDAPPRNSECEAFEDASLPLTGKSKKRGDGLKLENDPQAVRPPLDLRKFGIRSLCVAGPGHGGSVKR